MASLTTYALLLVSLCATTVLADPSNVLVGDLTFARPEKWKWEAPTAKSTAETRFVIPNDDGGSPVTDIRFYVEEKDAKHSDASWKALFPDASGPGNVIEEQKKIGRRTVNYLTLRGTYLAPGAKSKAKAGYLLISATIPFTQQVIRTRIMGPEDQVSAAREDFYRMVETALKEAE